MLKSLPRNLIRLWQKHCRLNFRNLVFRIFFFVDSSLFSLSLRSETHKEKTVFIMITQVFVNYFHMQRWKIMHVINNFNFRKEKNIFLYWMFPLINIHHHLIEKLWKQRKYVYRCILTENCVRLCKYSIRHHIIKVAFILSIRRKVANYNCCVSLTQRQTFSYLALKKNFNECFFH